jgi:hypothetical protein
MLETSHALQHCSSPKPSPVLHVLDTMQRDGLQNCASACAWESAAAQAYPPPISTSPRIDYFCCEQDISRRVYTEEFAAGWGMRGRNKPGYWSPRILHSHGYLVVTI